MSEEIIDVEATEVPSEPVVPETPVPPSEEVVAEVKADIQEVTA